MNTRNDIVNQLQDLIGDGGSREVAEAVYDILNERGDIEYTDAQGLELFVPDDLMDLAAAVEG